MEGIFAISQYDSGNLLKADSPDFADGKGEKKGPNCVTMYVKLLKYWFNAVFLQKTVTGKVLPRAPQILFYKKVYIIAGSSDSELLAKYSITFYT